MRFVWIFIYLSVLVWSAISPKDMTIWFLEAGPAIIAGILMLMTYNSFRLTPLLYIFILMHCIILMVGAHYTYAEVPLFDTLRLVFDFERNNYDKLGHFFQGLVPALVAREILIRKQVVNGSAWLNLFVVSICLAFSAFYELIEWWTALISEESAEAFLGTQGYIWDTQSDMGWALLGAITTLVVFARLHNRQLERLIKT
ncbi:MAG: DUF2238 domain-containing protein [Pseudomonadota bacterium]|nr:DUF2238 domain-containing protein [Pseudomonadota bacterium]